MPYSYPKYPAAIFNDTDFPSQADDTDWIKAWLVNALKEELQAALTELGTNPKGTYANVKARLEALIIGPASAVNDNLMAFDGITGKSSKDSGKPLSNVHAQNTDTKLQDGAATPVDSVVVDTGGFVNLPKQSGAKAYMSANQTIPTGSFTKVHLDTEDFDVQNEFDPTTNYRFTATKAGYYVILGNVIFADAIPAGTTVVERVLKNGAVAFYIQVATDGAAIGYTLGSTLHLTAGDYLELNVYQNSGASKDIYGGNYNTTLSVYKVG